MQVQPNIFSSSDEPHENSHSSMIAKTSSVLNYSHLPEFAAPTRR
jgi:hypothetical protein